MPQLLPPPTILIVEDHELTRYTLPHVLAHVLPGYGVHAVSTASEALAYLASAPVSCMLSDYHLPDMTGAGLSRMVRERWPTMPIVLLTGSHSPADLGAAHRAGCAAVLVKPSSPRQLRDTLRPLLPILPYPTPVMASV